MLDAEFTKSFIEKISTQALNSPAVNHPYLSRLAAGDFPNMDLAFKDFAFQYSLYSRHFTEYMSAVIESLSDIKHKQTLEENLAEELGGSHNFDLPDDVLKSVSGEPHSKLYQRFQEALGVDELYKKEAGRCQTAILWSEQTLRLCQTDQYIGVGVIGVGTELIVSSVYKQILEGLHKHSHLTAKERVFFDLHSECDDEHANQILSIVKDLAKTKEICDQIEFGAQIAINMRVMFWDKMLERAERFSPSIPEVLQKVSSVGY